MSRFDTATDWALVILPSICGIGMYWRGEQVWAVLFFLCAAYVAFGKLTEHDRRDR